MFYASFGTAVLVDAIITVSLYSLLIRSRTGFQKFVLTQTTLFYEIERLKLFMFDRAPDSIVSRCMLFTINTGTYAVPCCCKSRSARSLNLRLYIPSGLLIRFFLRS